jgi:hypothetical protein
VKYIVRIESDLKDPYGTPFSVSASSGESMQDAIAKLDGEIAEGVARLKVDAGRIAEFALTLEKVRAIV